MKMSYALLALLSVSIYTHANTPDKLTLIQNLREELAHLMTEYEGEFFIKNSQYSTQDVALDNYKKTLRGTQGHLLKPGAGINLEGQYFTVVGHLDRSKNFRKNENISISHQLETNPITPHLILRDDATFGQLEITNKALQELEAAESQK